ncbi:hypothetical protein [Streptomyces sp. SR-10]|uniref:hypothetical protein n=1 Tax=Streptomyces sp. SR-10 TaxID=3416442 RepID=UPI003CF0807C
MEVQTLSCMRGAMSGPLLLDLARSEDTARWPDAVAREDAASRRTYAARCALAEAQDAVYQLGPDRGPVPLPTAGQGAVMDLVGAGDEVAACWRRDPQEAADLVLELTAGGEPAVDEVLDAAVDAVVVTGLLALAEARAAAATDPSAAAELCLAAVPHLALAVTLVALSTRTGSGTTSVTRPR